MKFIKIVYIIFLLSLNAFCNVYAQNVLDDIEISERGDPADSTNAPSLAKERILKISESKKIFLISNESQTFAKGDFISLLLNSKLAVRALVAKTTDQNVAGVKITKIYSVALWNQLRNGLEVQVLKGDDSYFTNLEKRTDLRGDEKVESKIQDEDDLYNSTRLDSDDLSFDENDKRLIKPDNILALNFGYVEGKDNDGESQRYIQMNGAWAYQLVDNVWGEMQLGTNIINDFPSEGLDTRLINITLRGKYTFAAPLYSYIQPYIGYQILRADSPGAGVDDGRGKSQQELGDEADLVDSTARSRMVFGVTLLKRIVPGWFVRADLGLDIISAGLALEF